VNRNHEYIHSIISQQLRQMINAAEIELEGSLRNLLEQDTLQWVFVGGKGGVGKTTTSCCVAVQMSKARESVLVISTDPAHNLSDAFGQKFTKDPTLVNGFNNLYCMEVEPTMEVDDIAGDAGGMNSEAADGLKNMFSDMSSSIPGIDEAMSFAELMKMVQVMNFSCIIFDTAPTGHTLRLLSFPTIMNKALTKIMALKDKFSGMMGQFGSMFGAGGANADDLMGKLEQMRDIINKVNDQFKDPDRTTFVCVCIPEFLSLYETERLVQELTKFEIDTHNIVVNQVLFPNKDIKDLQQWFRSEEGGLSDEAKSIICKTMSRKRMQDKYIGQILDLYEDFHVVLMPLLDHEVRGVSLLQSFSDLLMDPDAREVDSLKAYSNES